MSSCARVDLVIEFQTDEQVALIVAAKYREANIPLIAIEIPHPGATYFGANNYEAGLMGGRHLGPWARQNWPTVELTDGVKVTDGASLKPWTLTFSVGGS